MLYDKKWDAKTGPMLEPWRQKLEPHQQLLLDAAQYIRDHGWTKYKLEASDGGVCLVGAVNAAATGSAEGHYLRSEAKVYDKAINALKFELRKSSRFGLMRWNDSQWLFGKHCVIKALERAARR